MVMLTLKKNISYQIIFNYFSLNNDFDDDILIMIHITWDLQEIVYIL